MKDKKMILKRAHGYSVCLCLQMGLLAIETGFLFAKSFFVLMLLFAAGELALFAGQAPCSKPPSTAGNCCHGQEPALCHHTTHMT